MPEIIVTPYKKLKIEDVGGENSTPLLEAFNKGSGHGLLHLDIANDNFTEKAEFAYWKDCVRNYLLMFTAIPNLENHVKTQTKKPATSKTVENKNLSAIFGIDIDEMPSSDAIQVNPVPIATSKTSIKSSTIPTKSPSASKSKKKILTKKPVRKPIKKKIKVKKPTQKRKKAL